MLMSVAEAYREIAPSAAVAGSPQRPTVGEVVEFLNWVAGQPRIAEAPALANAVKATSWMVEVDGFCQVEEKHMLGGDYDQTLADHRAELSRLIGEGEALIWGIGK